jgi:ABC-type nitrate/sulfonate/bicarbonate transport system substrate-binding protein
MSVALRLGYVPLLDAAPLIVAEAIGFAGEEGLHFDLHAAPSWARLRDMLALGQVEAAPMLASLPVAMALGPGRSPARFEALPVLNLNGNGIGVSLDLAARIRAAGHGFDFADAYAAGRALLAATRSLRIGEPFAFSMHRELLQYWLGALGAEAASLDIRTVPPPLMAQALAAGGALIRAAIWPDAGDNVTCAEAVEILSRPEYARADAAVLANSMTGSFEYEAGDVRPAPDFNMFFRYNATFPHLLGCGVVSDPDAPLGSDRRGQAGCLV